MYEKILVPLDGSPLAESILPEIRKLRSEYLPRLVLVRVCRAHTGTDTYSSEMEMHTMEGAETYLTQMKRRLNAEGYTVEIHVCVGDAAWEILDLAERSNAELIAMSTHGRSGIDRWLMGSVTEKVVRHSPKPVLLVRAHMME
jgi:nucleotide-binding universal stress UspA family protein